MYSTWTSQNRPIVYTSNSLYTHVDDGKIQVNGRRFKDRVQRFYSNLNLFLFHLKHTYIHVYTYMYFQTNTRCIGFMWAVFKPWSVYGHNSEERTNGRTSNETKAKWGRRGGKAAGQDRILRKRLPLHYTCIYTYHGVRHYRRLWSFSISFTLPLLHPKRVVPPPRYYVIPIQTYKPVARPLVHSQRSSSRTPENR